MRCLEKMPVDFTETWDEEAIIKKMKAQKLIIVLAFCFIIVPNKKNYLRNAQATTFFYCFKSIYKIQCNLKKRLDSQFNALTY